MIAVGRPRLSFRGLTGDVQFIHQPPRKPGIDDAALTTEYLDQPPIPAGGPLTGQSRQGVSKRLVLLQQEKDQPLIRGTPGTSQKLLIGIGVTQLLAFAHYMYISYGRRWER